MSLLGLLVALIVVCLLYWVVISVLSAFGVGDPIATIVKVLFVLIVVLWLLSAFGMLPATGLRLR